jgi:hypothetical protein
MTEILIIIFTVIIIIQLIYFSKLIAITKRLNKFLLEVRLYFKNSGLFYNVHDQSIMRSNTCQYCKHRMSYINISNEDDFENFYYRCKKQNIDILLSDSCSHFDRDYNLGNK